MTEGKREIIKGLLSEYDIQFAEDMEEVPKESSWWNHLMCIMYEDPLPD